MRDRILYFLLIVIIFISCNKQNKFPEPVTSPVDTEIVKLQGSLLNGFKNEVDAQNKFFGQAVNPENIVSIQQDYRAKNENFDLGKFETSWENFRNEAENGLGSYDAAQKWFEITGLLFQLTGKVVYADELERIAYTNFFGTANENNLKNALVPYIFTRNVDHIHVNLFTPAEISYEHSLGGHVEIIQNTDFPRSGSIKLHFSMETKRYLEVFIRIPGWAKDVSVEVKGVKYFAGPGNYCKVAKKWKEGDVVEIEIPVANRPDYL